MQYKNILSMNFNEIKWHVNTSLGLVGGCIPCIPPVSAPGYDHEFFIKIFGNHRIKTL